LIIRLATSWLVLSAVIRFCSSSISTASSSGLSGSETTTCRQALTRMSICSKASMVADKRLASASFSRRSPAK